MNVTDCQNTWAVLSSQLYGLREPSQSDINIIMEAYTQKHEAIL